MAVVKRKPTSPGRRFVVSVPNPELHKGRPYAALTESKKKSGGRNSSGRITCLLYTSPSPRDLAVSRMPSSA